LCFCTTTTTATGIITFLKMSSRPFHHGPYHAMREILDPFCWFRQWRRYSVIVPLLEAMSSLLVEPHVGNWSQSWPPLRAWASRVQYTMEPTSLLGTLSSGPVMSCRPLATSSDLGGLYVDGCHPGVRDVFTSGEKPTSRVPFFATNRGP
jgi:hypothetical protein